MVMQIQMLMQISFLTCFIVKQPDPPIKFIKPPVYAWNINSAV